MIDKIRHIGSVAVAAALLFSVACSSEAPPKQTAAAQVTTEVEVVAIAPVVEQGPRLQAVCPKTPLSSRNTRRLRAYPAICRVLAPTRWRTS